LLAAAILAAAGCTAEVPAGYKGLVRTARGWRRDLAPAGRVACWGRDVLWLVEAGETTSAVDVSVQLEQEEAHLGATVAVTFDLSDEDDKVMPVFDTVRPRGTSTTITLNAVFRTYAENVVKDVASRVLRSCTTHRLLREPAGVEKEVGDALNEALKGTPVSVKKAAIRITRMDFPSLPGDTTEQRGTDAGR